MTQWRVPGSMARGWPSADALAKAWINFNGEAADITIQTATLYQVTALTDNGAGDYTVTFRTGLFTSASTYAIGVYCRSDADSRSGHCWQDERTARTATSVRVNTGAGARQDAEVVSLIVWGR